MATTAALRRRKPTVGGLWERLRIERFGVSAMEAAAVDFGRPVLFVHGDGHNWLDDVPFAAPNIRRIQVEPGGAAVPLQVTVDARAAETFTLERMPF